MDETITVAKLAVAKHLIIRRGNDPPPLGGPVTVHFVVRCKQIRPWEFLFVTGSSVKLGSWQAEKAVELERCEQGNLWRTSIQIGPEESRQMLGFRYFIGYYLQATADPNSKIRIVARWESQRAPRCVLPSVEASAGVCRSKHVDEFGVYGGKELVTDGWLHDKEQKEILLRVHGEALKFYKSRHTKRQYFIKVTPFDLRHKEVGSADDDGDDSSDANSFLPSLPSFSITDLAVLSRDDPTFHDQAPSGELFHNKDEYFVFRTHSVAVDNLAFRIEFFVDANAVAREKAATQENGSASGEETAITPPEIPKFERAAIAYCMPSSMAGSYGSTSVPILAKTQQPIGQIKIDYLFIRALQRRETTPALTMDVTYCRHWKKRKTLEVGHRGMGNSYTKFAAARENTIHSLNHAANKGADFVEFDVQLTKDRHAVIFHDFHVLVSVAKRSSSLLDLSNGTKARGTADGALPHVADFHELAVKDLKLTQLQLLHLEHHRATEEANKDKLRVTGTPNEPPELRPFPTLADALKYVDADTGFNVEIKYPMMLKDGSHECENYFERNEYIDIILNDVLEHSGSRRIVFSSFDPDICSIIALKQNKFPVLFLWYSNEGRRYVPFLDERSSTSRIAVNFASSIKILGLNFHSEDLLRSTTPLKRANQFGLVSFVWGDDLDNQKNIDYFRKQLLVDGIVYDRIGEIEARRNIFTVEREAKSALFRAHSPAVSRSGSIDRTASDLAKALLLTGALSSDKEGSSRSASPVRSNSFKTHRTSNELPVVTTGHSPPKADDMPEDKECGSSE